MLKVNMSNDKMLKSNMLNDKMLRINMSNDKMLNVKLSMFCIDIHAKSVDMLTCCHSTFCQK
jgi:hypothetical protein